MPKKIRELKAMLRKAGFHEEPAKGSHTKWKHPKLARAIIMSGKDSNDARTYLEKQVLQALQDLERY